MRDLFRDRQPLCWQSRNWPRETANPVGMVVLIVRSHGPGDVGAWIHARVQADDAKRPEDFAGALILASGGFLEEKGTTPEPGGEARIPIGRGRDTPMTDTPLPSFTTPTPVHDGEPRMSSVRSVA